MALTDNESPFFADVIENGFHVFSRTHAKTSGFYPNPFPDYPGVKLSSLIIGDRITIRIFFRVGSGENVRIDGGYAALNVPVQRRR